MMMIRYDTIYSLTAIGLTPGDNSTVHFYTQQYTEQHNKPQYVERNIRNSKTT